MRATSPSRAHRARAGFTLVEMMMAILLTMMVFAITIPFFRNQTLAVDKSAGRLDALQNARFAQNAIDRELRMAGGATGQPIIVQAAPFSITFNVDLVTRFATDPNATYLNPQADSLAVESWEPSRSKRLPTSTTIYPTALYYDTNGNQSPAETISYFLYTDSTAGRSDIYTLYRRVNDRDSTVVSNNLWIPTDTAYFFHYYKSSASGALTLIPNATLPIYWNSASHLQDSIAAVYMRVAGLYRDVRKATDVTRTIYHRTAILNYGKLKVNICGNPPTAVATVTNTQIVDSLGNVVKISVGWPKSIDEGGGENDVGLYVVERRLSAGTDWEILANVVSQGTSTYAFDDFAFKSGTWVYGVIAQDCSPANSAVTVAGTNVTNP
jgi:type II secretory pathway pseudopilin PulG